MTRKQTSPKPQQSDAQVGCSAGGTYFALYCQHLREVFARTDIDAYAKLTYYMLLDHLGQNDYAHPSTRRLARELHLNAKTICRAVASLEAAGFLEVTRPVGNPARRANEYRLPKRPAMESAPPDGTFRQTDTERSVSRPRSAPPDGTQRTKRTHSENAPKKKARAQRKDTPSVDPWEPAKAAMSKTDLDTSDFRAAWERWVQYRREAGKKLTSSTIQAQIKKLEGLGHDRAVRSIESSIEQGWTGLFDPDADRGRRGGATRAVPRIEQRIIPRILNS